LISAHLCLRAECAATDLEMRVRVVAHRVWPGRFSLSW
jgi:hypothetical protein